MSKNILIITRKSLMMILMMLMLAAPAICLPRQHQLLALKSPAKPVDIDELRSRYLVALSQGTDNLTTSSSIEEFQTYLDWAHGPSVGSREEETFNSGAIDLAPRLGYGASDPRSTSATSGTSFINFCEGIFC